ncbi:MAG TPA: C1 family peptidase [Ferruginibacter sp.]|nr:C1 family peptidase [Ferruginibacter sp.]
MKRHFLLLSSIISISLLFNSCNSKDKKTATHDGKEVPLGMKFEPENKLAGIPLASTPFGGDELPASVDMSDRMPPIGNQGSQQSCVAWSIAYALKSYEEKVETGTQMTFSPSFIYNQINNGMNAPTYVTDGLNLLSDQGVCLLDEMPYNQADWLTKPTAEQKQHAKKFRIDFWRRVNVLDIKEVKAQLAAGYPVIIGADVSKEFINDGYAQKGAFIWKDAGTPAGGHCMLLVGYDDAKNAFKVMNSWGTEWGDNGFGWIDYKFFPEGVRYGFVAKDAVTPGAEDIAKDPGNNNPGNDQNTDPDNTVNNPYDDPTAYEKIDFSSTNVEHNVSNPKDPEVGNNMKIEGRVDIPAYYGKKFQIVVHIYNAATNEQVATKIYPRYSDINHYAAGYTPEYDITANGFRNGTWWVNIPYSAIQMPRGRNNFYAIPTLFVDNFGIAFGEKIEFYVDQP